ncbi:MAG: GDSL-type esterase/lipase family protein [Planctomycetota bacterium]
MIRVHPRAMIHILLLCFFGTTGWIVDAHQPSSEIPDPRRFETEILVFEKAEQKKASQNGSVLFVGSSTIRDWHSLNSDFDASNFVNRGFGGSRMTDVTYYLDRILGNADPRALVLYEGDNDIHEGVGVNELLDHYDDFYNKFRSRLPNCHLYVISIKPSPSRSEEWPKSRKANIRIKAWAESKPRSTYVDIATAMLNENGKPRKDLFKYDLLHMNRKGYRIWIDLLKPLFLKNHVDRDS